MNFSDPKQKKEYDYSSFREDLWVINEMDDEEIPKTDDDFLPTDNDQSNESLLNNTIESLESERDSLDETILREITLESKRPLHEDLFTDILQQRDLYLQFHQENPGVFYETVRSMLRGWISIEVPLFQVFTDDTKDCCFKLKKTFKTITEACNEPQEFVIEDSETYRAIVGERLRRFQQEIDE